MAAFLLDAEALAELALPLTVEAAGVAGMRVEVTTAEVGERVTFVVPCWTSKYMACFFFRIGIQQREIFTL